MLLDEIRILARKNKQETYEDETKPQKEREKKIREAVKMEKIAKKESFILVISQTTCSHCAEYKPRLQKLLAKYKIVGYFIEKDILSDEEVSRLNNIANISGTPTTVFIVDGEETSTATRLVGAKSTDAIVSRLKAMGYIDK